jgi:hypothetical protein
MANYNPYITVDYADNVDVNNAVGVNSAGVAMATAIANRASIGRKQTYTAHTSQWIAQNQLAMANVGQPQHTFYRQNGQGAMGPSTDPITNAFNDTMLDLPFDWLVHLDRQLISPMELLQVSAYPPHRLTQQFKYTDNAGTVQKFQHLAPWFDTNARIYRLLELLQTKSRIVGLKGDRVPGPININMIFDEEVWQALCDEQQATGVTKYDMNQVKAMFNALMTKRTPASQTGPAMPGQFDAPFKSLATGVVPFGDTWLAPSDIRNTFLCDQTGGGNAALPRMFEVPNQTHPYRKYELMTKIYNNLTVRSNVFAVFLTVGFFEVTDESVTPPRLGAEIGFAENRHVRYRMFSIVDRTQLAAQQSNFAQLNAPGITAPGMGTVQMPMGPPPITAIPIGQFTPNPNNSLGAPTSAYTLGLQPGMTLTFDLGNAASTETVVIQSVDQVNSNFTAYFTTTHMMGAPISVGGPQLAGPLTGSMAAHPGPGPAMYANYYPTPVMYYSIIDGK